jgi:hypothetical protein
MIFFAKNLFLNMFFIQNTGNIYIYIYIYSGGGGGLASALQGKKFPAPPLKF